MGETSGAAGTADAGGPERDVRAVAVQAIHVLTDVVQRIDDGQWALPAGPTVTTSERQGDATLRDIVTYHAYDDAWVPAMLAGSTMEEVGADAFEGDLLFTDAGDPRERFTAIAGLAAGAVRAVDAPEGLAAVVHCSFGDFSVEDYLWQVVVFRALRAVEIARLVGVGDQLPDDLVAALGAYLEVHAEQWRAWGVFGPAVTAPEGASAQQRLLALTGRDPG